MNKKYLRKISNYSVVGSFAAIIMTSLYGCEQKPYEDNTITKAANTQNAFVVIEKAADGSYKIADEFPAQKTTIVLRDENGVERILNQEEIDKLVKEEALKIENGTSSLTEPSLQNQNSMGLGGVLLSSLAGAAIGSYIGNKLFNNPNFQAQKSANYKSPQAYSRSMDSFKKAQNQKTSTQPKKSGFFSSDKKRTSGSFGG